ncbi:hypothetical protein AHF37_11418 [Paragonimus kellicotti]|nr:hypothetical protein AHF37_11418 [Paragonimus kellicotti]
MLHRSPCSRCTEGLRQMAFLDSRVRCMLPPGRPYQRLRKCKRGEYKCKSVMFPSFG